MDTLADAIAAALVDDGLSPVQASRAGRLAAGVAVEHLVGDLDGAALLLAGEQPMRDRRWRRAS